MIVIETLLNGLTWYFFLACFIMANVGAFVTISKDVKRGIKKTSNYTPTKWSWTYFWSDNWRRVVSVEAFVCAAIILGDSVVGLIPMNGYQQGGITLIGAFFIGLYSDKAVKILQSKSR